MIIDVKALDDDWGSRIKNYDYLGEFALTINDYENYFSFYKEQCVIDIEGSSFPKLTCENILIVLTVNCAYFEYDEIGFWFHFLKRLGLEDRPTYIQTKIGNQIEKYLFTNRFIEKKKEGPLRYVGPILEQTGITRKHLPKFVEFLRYGVERYGWSGLIAISKFMYEKILPTQQISKYLLSFLKDSIGFEFVKSVARSIEQSKRESDQLEFLKNLKGYHPSFWTELLEYLQQDDVIEAIVKKNNTIPIPQFTYQPFINNRIAIIFDDDHVSLKRYKLFDEIVARSSIELFDSMDFNASYEICMKDEFYEWHELKIKGWSPDKQPYAFFDPKSGELLDDKENLPNDEVFFVVSANFIEALSEEHRIKFERIIIGEFGWLTTPVGLKGFLITHMS